MGRGALVFMIAALATFGGVALGADNGAWTCGGEVASSHILWAEGSGFKTERLAIEAALEGSFGVHEEVAVDEVRKVEADQFEVGSKDFPVFVSSVLVTVTHSESGYRADELQVCQEVVR